MNAIANATIPDVQTEHDPRWPAVVARDGSFDGQFYFSVKTTGVYCMPSCAARRARPENIRFHSTRADAELAGFRACKRCKPDRPALIQQHAATIAQVCGIIETAQEMPTLDELARAAGLSTYHFHRVFKSITGVTPRAYAVAHRSKRVREELDRTQTTVTTAIYDAGFRSSANFYSTADAVLGMTPTAYRSGGENTQIRFAIGECTLGSILVATTTRGVCAIFIGDDPEILAHDLQDRFPRADLIGDDTGFEELVAKVVGFVEAPALGLDLPLDVRGTAFQQRVWQELRTIPAGSTLSYSEIARKIGLPKAVRGVAQACAANAIALGIPCHRVVRSDGALAGYRWGVERKRALLAREAREKK